MARATRRTARPASRRPRLHAARDRHRRDRDALVGDDRRGRRAPDRAARGRGARPLGAGARRDVSSAPRPASASRSRCPGLERSRLAPRRRARRAGAPSGRATASTSSLEELDPIADGAARHRPPRHRREPGPGRAGRRALGAAPALSPVVAARGDRVVLRAETTIGGGLVLDPAPPRHADPARFERLERGDLAATIDAPVRAAELRPSRSTGELDGVERAGDWLFSRAWLDELRAELDARIDGRRSARPGRRAAGRAVGAGRRAAARPRAARLAALPSRAPRRRSARAAAEAARARARARRGGAGRDEGRRSPTSPGYLEQRGSARPARRRLRARRAAYERRGRARPDASARPPAGSRSPASATSRASAAATRSSLLERMDADGVTRRVGERAGAQAQVVCDTLSGGPEPNQVRRSLSAGEAVRDVVRRDDRDRPAGRCRSSAGRRSSSR